MPNEYTKALQATSFQLYPEHEYAWFPVASQKTEYFDEYAELTNTSIGHALNAIRIDIVKQFGGGKVLDVGIGAGAFIDAYIGAGGVACGFDVDSKSIAWLRERGMFLDPYTDNLSDIDALTFWDSLEHIEEPELILRRLTTQHVFVSMPVFPDIADMMKSKHFKVHEHRMYFTERGLIHMFEWFGFECLNKSHEESDIGRDGVTSFVFKRKIPSAPIIAPLKYSAKATENNLP